MDTEVGKGGELAPNITLKRERSLNKRAERNCKDNLANSTLHHEIQVLIGPFNNP